jgi:hypothetical protein
MLPHDSDQGNGGFGGDALAFGMMNSLRTGNAGFDMLVVVLVLLVMTIAAALVENGKPWVSRAAIEGTPWRTITVGYHTTHT